MTGAGSGWGRREKQQGRQYRKPEKEKIMSKLELRKVAPFAYKWYVGDAKVGGHGVYFQSKKEAEAWRKRENISIENYVEKQEEWNRREARLDAEIAERDAEFAASRRRGRVE